MTKQHITTLSLLLSICCLLPATAFCQDELQQQKDSLRRQIAATEGKDKLELYKELCFLSYPENETDTLLLFCREFMKETQRQNDKENEAKAREFELAFLFNYNRHDEFFTKIYEHLDFFKQNNFLVTYYTTYRHVLEIYFGNGNRDKALKEVTALYEQAKADNYPYGIASATYIMAIIHVDTGQHDEGEKYYRETLSLLQDSHELLKLEAYYRLCDLLIQRDALADASELLVKWRKEIDEVAKENNGVVHGTLWHDYFQSQIHLNLACDDFDKAENYCDSVETRLQDGRVYSSLYRFRSVISENREDYEKALSWSNEAYQYALEDDNLSFSTDVLIDKGRLLCKLGRGNEAYPVYELALTRLDSIRSNEITEQLSELRTQYEVDKHIAEKERNRNYFLFSLAGCILLALVLCGYIYYNRLILRKNRALFLRIKEQARLAKELEQSGSRQADTPQEDSPQEDSRETYRDRQQRELVARFHDCLLRDKYFTHPDLDINVLTADLATNRTTLFDSIKTVTGKTPNEYICALQLEEARSMLETNTTLTITAISEACGFNSVRTFHRHFREQYNITPAEYRKIARQVESHN